MKAMIYLFITAICGKCVHGKVIEGRLRTHKSYIRDTMSASKIWARKLSMGITITGSLLFCQKWEFLTRFCFLSQQGQFHFKITYPVDFAVQRLLLYYDAPHQWASVYHSGKNCTEKLKPLNVTNLQFVNLTESDELAGCFRNESDPDNPLYECEHFRSFSSARERWWYIALANCESEKGLDLTYEITMTNGDPGDFWFYHFSVDEFYILRTDIVALAANVFMLIIAILEAIELKARQLLHKTYKLFISSLTFQTAGVLLLMISYAKYAADGKGWNKVKVTGQILESVSVLLMVLLLLLVAKGYTITRGRLRIASSIKITIFVCIYTVCYAALFMYQALFFDPGLVLYLYQSYPGYGLIVLRIAAWLTFCWGVFFTLKHYPEKAGFYFPFFLFYTVWFLSGPVVIVISNHIAPDWAREKIVNGVDHGIAVLGHVAFLIMTRPSAANKNFPFHVRTSQIDVMENSLAGTSGNNALDGFGHHNYSLSNTRQRNGSAPSVNSFIKASPAQIFTVATTNASGPRGAMFRTPIAAVLPPLKPAGKNDQSFPHETPPIITSSNKHPPIPLKGVTAPNHPSPSTAREESMKSSTPATKNGTVSSVTHNNTTSSA